MAFTKGGYHATHVEQIVEAAGVARGTFYLHFESKHAVFEALVDRMLALFLEARPTGEEPGIRTRADAEEILRASYETVLGTFHKHRKLVALVFDEAVGLGKGFRKKLESHYREWGRRVAHTLTVFQERGIARPDLDVEVTAEMVIGMTERVTRQFILPRARPDLERCVEALVAYELGGCER